MNIQSGLLTTTGIRVEGAVADGDIAPAYDIVQVGAVIKIAVSDHIRERDVAVRQDAQTIAARVTIESARVDADIAAAGRVVYGDSPSRVAAAGHVRECDVPAISNGDALTSIAVGVHIREARVAGR